MSYRLNEKGEYVRTVRCGYCYEQGHNKGTCEAKKQNHKDQIVKYKRLIEEDNFADEWQRENIKRFLANHEAQLDTSRNPGKSRRCSYCRENGHTRRTCSSRKGDMKSWSIKTIDAREKFVDNMVGVGLGVGALGYRRVSYGSDELTIIQSISWEEINYRTAAGKPDQWSNIIQVRDVETTDYYPTGRVVGIRLPLNVSRISAVEERDNAGSLTSGDFQIVSPADVNPPADFLTLDAAQRAAKKSDIFAQSRAIEYRGVTYNDE